MEIVGLFAEGAFVSGHHRPQLKPRSCINRQTFRACAARRVRRRIE
jgi:hypothetical protein